MKIFVSCMHASVLEFFFINVNLNFHMACMYLSENLWTCINQCLFHFFFFSGKTFRQQWESRMFYLLTTLFEPVSKHIEHWKAKNSKHGQTNSVSIDKLSNQLTLCTIYIYRVKLFISCASEQNFPLKCVQYSKPLCFALSLKTKLNFM